MTRDEAFAGLREHWKDTIAASGNKHSSSDRWNAESDAADMVAPYWNMDNDDARGILYQLGEIQRGYPEIGFPELIKAIKAIPSLDLDALDAYA